MSTRSDKPPDEKTTPETPPADPPAPPPPAPPAPPAPAAPPPPAPAAARTKPKPEAPPAPAARAKPGETIGDLIQRPSTPQAQKDGIKAARKVLKAAGIDVPKDADVMAAAEAYGAKQKERKAERKELKAENEVATASATAMIEYELSTLTTEQQAGAKLLLGNGKPVEQLQKLLDLKKSKMFGGSPTPPAAPPAPPAGGTPPPAAPPGGKVPVEPPARTAPNSPAPPAGGGTPPPDVKTEIARIESTANEQIKRGLGRNPETKRSHLIAAIAKSENARALYKDDHSTNE
jgi:hypothetical protein